MSNHRADEPSWVDSIDNPYLHGIFAPTLHETQACDLEVEGELHELTGSAEVQYTQWRALLRRIYISETGFASPSAD